MRSSVSARMFKKPLPVLFAHIGWAENYDGAEPVKGSFSFLKQHQNQASEAYAFCRDENGQYRCGIGRGAVHNKQLHVVFVARDPMDQRVKIVGLYPGATVEMEDDRAVAVCKRAVLIPVRRRPRLQNWPVGRGMRRWASRAGDVGSEHSNLRQVFTKLISVIGRLSTTLKIWDGVDEEIGAFEGKLRKHFVKHRQRERRLRSAKIREALLRNGGRLLCEVPGCGFNFSKRYGEIGLGYAQVHHLHPLSSLSMKGERRNLRHLAIVCANCHVMIHLGGQCRPMRNLIKSSRQGR